MKTQDLIRYGVDPRLIDIWRSSGIETLLPVQRIAVDRYNLFNGGNLIVSAPTSSGKTFIGEMAAAHTLLGHRRCFYLVPLKALAAEKFETFRERYAPLGARVVMSTRDCRQFDDEIAEGRFQIAVVVYEKMQQILIQTPDALEGVRLVVADELQTLADAGRGADIEVLLTRLRLSKASFQFVGLSAVLRDSGLLSKWLGAQFLQYCERPVELRRGVVYQGTFEYETYNTHERGTEAFLPLDGDLEAWEILMANAVWLAEKGEQSLVFLADKRSTRAMALRAAEQFHGPAAATEAIAELEGLEETQSRQMLFECLRSGIAFHNADLSLEERRAVERHFRSGSIRVICATPTLALGVNLPVKNVFLEPALWELSRQTGRPYRRMLTKGEYENMGGRAGRLNLEGDFGRSILVATTPLECMQYENCYLRADLEELEPQLRGVDLATHAMRLVAADAAHGEAEVARFLRHTLTGVKHERALREDEKGFQERVAAAVERCVKYGLLRRAEPEGTLAATSLGRLCAVKGIAAATGHELHTWLASLRGRSFPDAEALYVLCRTEEARDEHLNMSTDEYRSWAYPEELAALLPPLSREFFAPVFESRNYQTYEEVKPMKMALLLHAWVQGEAAARIEERYESLAGTIRTAAEACAWLADAASAVADLLRLPEDHVKCLGELSTRLAIGVAPEGLALCEIEEQGFGRTHVARLLRAGLGDPEAVRRAPEAVLKRVLGSKMAEKLRRRLPPPRETRASAAGRAPKAPRAERAAAPDSEDSAEGAAGSANGLTFRKRGERWEVCYDGQTVHVEHRVGMDYLALLLSRPACAFPADRLRAAVAGVDTAAPGSAEEVIDAQALAEYSKRLREVKEELSEAVRDHDAGRQERLQEEVHALTRQLAGGTGLDGGPRLVGGEPERARKAVSMAITRVLGRIKEVHPTLWQHLQRSVQRGRVFCYAPDAPLSWAT